MGAAQLDAVDHEPGVLAALLVSHALFWPISPIQAEELFDPEIRAAVFKRKDGLIAHIRLLDGRFLLLSDISPLSQRGCSGARKQPRLRTRAVVADLVEIQGD